MYSERSAYTNFNSLQAPGSIWQQKIAVTDAGSSVTGSQGIWKLVALMYVRRRFKVACLSENKLLRCIHAHSKPFKVYFKSCLEIHETCFSQESRK